MIISLMDFKSKTYLGEFDCQGFIPDKLDIIDTRVGKFRVLLRIIDYTGSNIYVELYVVKV